MGKKRCWCLSLCKAQKRGGWSGRGRVWEKRSYNAAMLGAVPEKEPSAQRSIPLGTLQNCKLQVLGVRLDTLPREVPTWKIFSPVLRWIAAYLPALYEYALELCSLVVRILFLRTAPKTGGRPSHFAVDLGRVNVRCGKSLPRNKASFLLPESSAR
jgi:hypothetical protein